MSAWKSAAPLLASASVLLATSLMASSSIAAVRLTPVATVSGPVFVTHNGDRRLFVVELSGRIRIVDPVRGVLPVPFLDIDDKVSGGGERGLFSMAFHPDRNGLFYVYYTANDGAVVIERYRVSAGNPDLADPASGQRLLAVPHPATNHNGGQLQIGPRDGHLYAALGDGGGGGDETCQAQRRDSLHGKMLRLDVRQNLNQAPFYGIPAGNPFRGAADPTNLIPDEIWALGLRNPWRFSFDRATGDLFIGDVGQDAIEEIDLLRASAPGGAGGANLGWKIMEGTRCFGTGGCPAGVPACGASELIRPVHEFGREGGDCSVIGGYVYRGNQAGELWGRYLFTDLCSGNLRALTETSPGNWQVQTVLRTSGGVTSFGEGSDGELYLTLGNEVHRLVSDGPPVPRGVPAAGGRGPLLALALTALAAIAYRRSRRRV